MFDRLLRLQIITEVFGDWNLALFEVLGRPSILRLPSHRYRVPCKADIRPCRVDDFLLSQPSLLVELKQQPLIRRTGGEQFFEIFLFVDLRLFLNILRPIVLSDNPAYALGPLEIEE
jgi:hypothetical protein